MKPLRNSLFIILCSLVSTLAFAQSGSIKGLVVDSLTRKPLLEASVSLLSARDSSLVTFGITDGDGRFSFPKVSEGAYRVLVTYVGYQSRSRRVTVSNANATADAGTIELVSQTQTLGEVQVQGEKAPIAVKGDTLEFNADSFKTRPNSQVEDLLKKLPGVEVSRDGTVKAQGQEVKKVLVDGKPFFGNDPKMATRNLPADIIDKVQLYDQQSEQSQFSGVDDGDREKTINITTKKDKRKGTFGQQSFGAGPQAGDETSSQDMRYSGRASVNRFNNGRQFSVLGMANNINQQGFTAQDLGLGSNFGGAGQGMGGNAGGGNLMRMGGGNGGSGGSGGQVGNNAITQSWAAGLNYRDSWGKKIDLAGSYNASHTNTLTDQRSRRENVLPTSASASGKADSSFVTNRQNGSNNANTNHRFNLRLDYRIDSLTTLRVIPNLSWLGSGFQTQSMSQTIDGQGVAANSSNTNYNSTGSGFTGNNTLLLFRKFRKRGRTFSINWNAALNNQTNDGINRSVNTFARSNAPVFTSAVSTSAISTSITDPASQPGLFEQVINQRNDQQTNSRTNSVNVSYTEPLSLRQTLEFHYVLSDNRNSSNRFVNNFNEASGRYDQPNSRLSNQFLNAFMTNRGGVTWQTNRLKYTYALGVDAQQATLRSDNITRDTTFSRAFMNLLPNALFTYNFGKSRR
ncbi:MAG: TonB-dependent receptor, partial [Spirosoma sp.]|nr:TonB-dependent receptor [Spirosoma sp.]